MNAGIMSVCSKKSEVLQRGSDWICIHGVAFVGGRTEVVGSVCFDEDVTAKIHAL